MKAVAPQSGGELRGGGEGVPAVGSAPSPGSGGGALSAAGRSLEAVSVAACRACAACWSSRPSLRAGFLHRSTFDPLSWICSPS